MKTYVVNMQKDISKRQLITKQLSLHSELDSQIWSAVEGKKLSDEEQQKCISPLFKKRYGKNASLPAAGCSLSHYNIYQSIVDNGIKYALILEDDAILTKSPYCMENVIKLLDSCNPVVVLLTPDFWYKKKDIVEKYDRNHLIVSVYDAYMTSGYLINYAAAKLLSDNLFPIQFTADAWKDFISLGVNLYGVVPHIVSFPDGVGEIGSSVINSDNSYLRLRIWIIKLFFRILSKKKYLQGHRMSKKLWR